MHYAAYGVRVPFQWYSAESGRYRFSLKCHMRLVIGIGFVTIATKNQNGTSNTRRGRCRRPGSRALLNSARAATSRAMSCNYIAKGRPALPHAGTRRDSIANARAWEKTMAQVIPVVGGTRSMKHSPCRGEFKNMLVDLYALQMLLDM